MIRISHLRITALVLLALAALVVVLTWDAPLMAEVRGWFDREALMALVERAGIFGPIIIVVAMTMAVVASPIPSAPIALAAGAAYGHVLGTLIVVAGAEIGALLAFGLARFLGREAVQRWFGDRVEQGLAGSQNALTLAVFLSRLMPFVSFDIISYAAGLSALRFWRFALATLAGIVPASFVLSHLGTTAMTGGGGLLTWGVAALGLATGLPVIWAVLRQRDT